MSPNNKFPHERRHASLKRYKIWSDTPVKTGELEIKSSSKTDEDSEQQGESALAPSSSIPLVKADP